MGLFDGYFARMWISRLYQALHPSVYLLGSLAQFSPSLIPDCARYLERLKIWIRELVYDLSSYPTPFFITNLLISLDLSLTFDKPEFNNYIHRAKFLQFSPISDYLRGPDGPDREYVISDAISSLRDDHFPGSLTRGILFFK